MGEGKLLHMGKRTNPNRVYTMRGIEIFQKPLCREIRPMWGLPTRRIRLYIAICQNIFYFQILRKNRSHIFALGISWFHEYEKTPQNNFSL